MADEKVGLVEVVGLAVTLARVVKRVTAYRRHWSVRVVPRFSVRLGAGFAARQGTIEWRVRPMWMSWERPSVKVDLQLRSLQRMVRSSWRRWAALSLPRVPSGVDAP
jgi:hypothetical protein